MSGVGRTAFQRCPHSNPWNLWIGCVTWKNGLYKCKKITEPKTGRLSWVTQAAQSNYMSRERSPFGARESQLQQQSQRLEAWERLDLPLLEESSIQSISASANSQKRDLGPTTAVSLQSLHEPRSGFCPTPSKKEMQLCQHTDFGFVRPEARAQTSDLQKLWDKFVLF